MRAVRQAVARCDRAGLTVTCQRVGDLDGELRAAVVRHAGAWRDGAVERGFSMALGRLADPADEDGIVEQVVVGLMAEAPAWGIRRCLSTSRCSAASSHAGRGSVPGRCCGCWRSVLLAASRFWQIESLYRANAKFQPERMPRFVCFRSSSDVPRVSMAALRAEAFVVAPRWLQRLVGG